MERIHAESLVYTMKPNVGKSFGSISRKMIQILQIEQQIN